jgi:hypothetical protein
MLSCHVAGATTSPVICQSEPVKYETCGTRASKCVARATVRQKIAPVANMPREWHVRAAFFPRIYHPTMRIKFFPVEAICDNNTFIYMEGAV